MCHRNPEIMNSFSQEPLSTCCGLQPCADLTCEQSEEAPTGRPARPTPHRQPGSWGHWALFTLGGEGASIPKNLQGERAGLCLMLRNEQNSLERGKGPGIRSGLGKCAEP